MTEKIIVERKENGKIVFQGEISRKSQAELMNFIKDFYRDDNEVSTKLSKYLPHTVRIQLDVTRNNSKDIPSIEICPVCSHPKAFFEIKAENY